MQKYAEICSTLQKICRNMQKSIFCIILHIYALPTLLMGGPQAHWQSSTQYFRVSATVTVARPP